MSRQARTSGDRRTKRNISEKVEKFLENEREDFSGHSYDDAPSPKFTQARARRRWTISEELSRPHRESKDDSEDESPDARRTQKPGKSSERNRMREKHRSSLSNDREVDLAEKRKRSRHNARRKKMLGRSREAEDNYSQDEEVGRSLKKFHGDPDAVQKSRKKREPTRGAGDKEVPITEILRRSQENARTKYEDPVPLPQLTTDTIYVQGKNGFSAVRISATKSWRRSQQTARKSRRGRKSLEDTAVKHPHITVAIFAQRLWKRTGIVFQGLLGGMAFLHFIMARRLEFRFSASAEFVREYSALSEIYASLFSLLVGLCVVSIFDKFDLARLDVDHAREIYGNHGKSALAVPFYVAAFGLHQATSRIDDSLALDHYQNYQNVNASVWPNDTSAETFLQDLIIWQRLAISQDLMAVFAWFFVSLGTRDDMLLTHLESMEKYANSIESN